MKTIGLIGGMSWESTIPYYRIINETAGKELGGFHSAKIILYSVDFSELEKYMSEGKWENIAGVLTDAAIKLECAGADVILVCTNTMHKLFPNILEKVKVPMIHIADATADELEEKGIRKVALLGTKYTMTGDFYKSRLKERGFDVVIPGEEDIELINSVIFDELCKGIVKDSSRQAYAKVIEKLRDNGAEGVILGCTEIGMLVSQKDSVIPVFDTTVIHAKSAAKFALKD